MATKSHQYLEEGFLEAYLTGLTSEQEQDEMKHFLAENSDVQDELSEMETDMEQFFMRHAVPPPPGLRNAVINRINETEIQKWKPGYEGQSQSGQATENHNTQDYRNAQYVNVEVDNTHIRVHKYWRPAFIAIFVLSKIFLIAGLYYYFKADSIERELNQLRQQNSVQQPMPARPFNTR